MELLNKYMKEHTIIENGMTIETMVKMVNESRISAIFCADSEFENVLV